MKKQNLVGLIIILSIIMFLPLAEAKFEFSDLRSFFSTKTTLSTPILDSRNTFGQIAFWDENNDLTGDNALFWDNVNKRLGIGTITPGVALDIEVTNGGAATIGSIGNVATGLYSIAMGHYTTASGDYSTAMGHLTEATGDYAIAMGEGTTASGTFGPTAMGYYTTASGSYSTAIGREIQAGADYVVAIGLADMNDLNCNQANSMCIMGGKVGIGTVSPTETLDVEGKVYASEGFKLPIMDDLPDCDEEQEGLMLISSSEFGGINYKKVMVCIQVEENTYGWRAIFTSSWGGDAVPYANDYDSIPLKK